MKQDFFSLFVTCKHLFSSKGKLNNNNQNNQILIKLNLKSAGPCSNTVLRSLCIHAWKSPST